MLKEKSISYCGFCCEQCYGYTGSLAKIATQLKEELKKYRFDQISKAMMLYPPFKVLENYDQFSEILDIFEGLKCDKFCQEGGGNPFCAIKKCCLEKGYQGCWECGDSNTCEKINFMKVGHGCAHEINFKRIKEKGLKDFVKGEISWYDDTQD